jgi:phosphate/sulfate permease
MAKDPAWQRIVGGLCGVGIMIAVLLLLRQRGVSGEAVEQWQMAAAAAAAATLFVLWILKRRRQDRQ